MGGPVRVLMGQRRGGAAEAGTHLERAHQGCQRHSLLSWLGPFASVGGSGRQDQDLGRVPGSEVHADLHGLFQGECLPCMVIVLSA